jgi:pilus assembly protein Flp/PilA
MVRNRIGSISKVCAIDMPPVDLSVAVQRHRLITMRPLLLRFAKDDTGVTAIEYGLIASLIAVVIITSVTLVGTDLTTQFNAIAAAL